MAARISENGLSRQILTDVANARIQVAKYGEQVSSGYKVRTPGDTDISSTISQFRQQVERIEGYKRSISSATATIALQDDVLKQVSDLLIRAKELATQAANEPNNSSARATISNELFGIRDAVINFANTTYQGRYIFGGFADDQPPFNQVAGYTNPPTGEASERYQYTAAPGANGTRTIKVSEDVSVDVNTPGSNIFSNIVYGLEKLGRSLAGYDTNLVGGVPDGTGNAYVFPGDLDVQTRHIRESLDMLDSARDNDLMPERVDLGARLNRLEMASSILEVNKTNAEDLLGKLQNADPVESISNLTQAQSALDAALQVTVRVLRQSILDYI